MEGFCEGRPERRVIPYLTGHGRLWLITSLMVSFCVRRDFSAFYGPPSSAKSIDELVFITKSQGDLSGAGYQLEPTLSVLEIPSSM